MKMFKLLSLLVLVSCASGPSSDRPSKAPIEGAAVLAKKEKPLTKTEVKDYYGTTAGTVNPALEDETIDRMNEAEVDKLKLETDPLLEIAVLCSQENYSKAFGVASKAFNQFQKIPSYWNLVGNCHLRQGGQRKALLFYNKALEVSPGYIPALNNIGVLYSRQGDDQKALIAFERANKTSKFAKTPRYNLARLYLKYGLADQALPLFQGLLGESATDVELINAVGTCYFIMSDYQRAISNYDLIPKKYWERPEIGLNIALTLNKIGRTEEAKKVFDDVDSPKSNELREYKAQVAGQLGVN